MMTKKTGILILAAGNSSRLGQPKQLLEFNGNTLLNHTLEQALKVSSSTIVVTGSKKIEIERELHPSITYYNPNWEKGMGSSLNFGLQQLLSTFPDINNCIISVCDQPFINASIFRQLIEKQKFTDRGIVASAYSDILGIPVLFTKKYFSELLKLSGNEGAKKLLLEFKEDVAEINFEEGATDIDTIADYEQLIKLK
jgi:molybdenum cofactor cytidylyltransferase